MTRASPSRRPRTGLHPLARRGVAAAVAAALAAGPAWALPEGAVVVQGSAVLSTAGATLTVTNSPGAVIHWGRFSIGAGETARFVQNSSASAVLNRVTGQDPSQILGALQSNGRVFLINPNGIVFGQGAQIDVAGLVASSLNLSDADFAANRLRFSGSGTEGAVRQLGRIVTPTGGQVLLIAPQVENQGLINAPNGDILLAAGHSVEVADSAQPALRVLVTAPQGSAVNLGQLLAESGRIGLHAATVANSGTVSASSAVAEGGRVYLRATQAITLADSSVLSADGTRGGEVSAITSTDGTRERVSGTLQAGGLISARGDGSAGSGGFVETSAGTVDANAVAVDTGGGTWLIDPGTFTIAASGGNITGSALSTSLGGGNVVILSSSGTVGLGGDINVNDAVSWSANNLTLTAARDININAVMSASGSSTLTLNTATANGVDSAVAGGTLRVGISGTATFGGRVDFGARSGTGLLTINGQGYTVLNGLGAQGSTSGLDLQGMGGNLAGFYALGADIDAAATAGWNAGAGFLPIGNSSTPFTGTLEGLGHVVSNLTVNRPLLDEVGLIGAASGVSAVRNLGLVGAAIAGANQVGGLIGTTQGRVANSFVTGTVQGQDSGGANEVGGLVGYADAAQIEFSHATAAVSTSATGGGSVGGLVGGLDSGSSVSDSYATGAVSITGDGSDVGGLVGYLDGSVLRSFATGAVTVTGDGNSVGGLVGYLDWFSAGTVADSYAKGSISITGPASNVGGLIGWSDHFSGTTVSRVYATGAVSGGDGSDAVGGLIGFSNGGGFSDGYATGSVTVGLASARIGGMAGDSSGFLNAYASGLVTAGAGSTEVGGLIGARTNINTFSGGFWNITTSGQSVGVGGGGSSAGITGVTDANFRQFASFTGFNFTSVWNLDTGTSYPYLRSIPQTPRPGVAVACCTWDGGASTLNWLDALNWSSDTLPGSLDAVTIGTGVAVSLASGTVAIASLTVGSSNSLSLSGGSFTVSGATSLGGTLNVSGSAAATLTGGISGATSGQLALSGGTLNLAGTSTLQGASLSGGTLNLTAGSLQVFGTLSQSALLNLASGTTFTHLASWTNNGTLKGLGTVNVGGGNTLTNAGTIAPGASPGTLSITGNFAQGPGGTLAIELGGLTAGSGYDLLSVSGNVALDGTLAATLFGGFAPVVGNGFTPITAGGTLSGTFATLNMPAGYTFTPAYGAAAFDLNLTAVSLPASSGGTGGLGTVLDTTSGLLNLGAVGVQTPGLYQSGQGSSTASSSGGLTQSAEQVLPALAPSPGSTAAGERPTPALASLISQVILDARTLEFPDDSHLVCR